MSLATERNLRSLRNKTVRLHSPKLAGASKRPFKSKTSPEDLLRVWGVSDKYNAVKSFRDQTRAELWFFNL